MVLRPGNSDDRSGVEAERERRPTSATRRQPARDRINPTESGPRVDTAHEAWRIWVHLRSCTELPPPGGYGLQ